MATSQTLTASPTALSGLTVGTWYTVQNRGNESFYMETATSEPDNRDKAFVVAPFSMVQVRRGTSGENIYVCQDDIRGDGSFGTLIVAPSE